MDLTDILRKRTEADLTVATARCLELSLEIEVVAAKLQKLRDAAYRAEADRDTALPSPSKSAFVVANPSEAHVGAGRQESTGSFFRSILGKLLGRQSELQEEPEPQAFHWYFDEIAGNIPARDDFGVNASIASTSFPAISMSGWVVPLDNAPAFGAVEVALTGKQGSIAASTQTHNRPDVAAHFGYAAASWSGFHLEIPMAQIPVGQYAIRISCRAADGNDLSVLAGSITIS